MEQENKETIVQENEVTETDKLFAETLAMEMIRDEHRHHKSKNLVICVLGGVTAIAIIAGAVERQRLVSANLQNDREWRELFSQYDYVSQDGNGQNYYNSDIGGNVNNGTTSEEAIK